MCSISLVVAFTRHMAEAKVAASMAAPVSERECVSVGECVVVVLHSIWPQNKSTCFRAGVVVKTKINNIETSNKQYYDFQVHSSTLPRNCIRGPTPPSRTAHCKVTSGQGRRQAVVVEFQSRSQQWRITTLCRFPDISSKDFHQQ